MTKRERFLAGEIFAVVNDSYRYRFVAANGEFSCDCIQVNEYPGSTIFGNIGQITHCTESATYYSYTDPDGNDYTGKLKFETIIFEENTQQL